MPWRKSRSAAPGPRHILHIAEWPFDQAIALLDLKGNLLAASPLLRRWLHEASTSFEGFFKPEQSDLLAAASRERIDGVRRLGTWPLTGGRKVDVDVTTHEAGTILLMHDATGRLEAERQLVRLRHNSELALQSRAEFLGRMSHELRTPLNSVIGFSQMIESRLHGAMEPELYRTYLGHILTGGKQLLERIDHLGAVSEAELGIVDICASEHSLREIVERAVSHLQRSAFEHGVTLRIEAGEDVVATVDAMLMIGVVGRLISNAVAACKPGGEVTLGVSALGGKPTIRVNDSGCGLPGAVSKALGEAFAGDLQAHGSAFGCGLLLSCDYLRLHDAVLDVIETGGQGTTLEIRLPESSLAAGVPPLRRHAAAA